MRALIALLLACSSPELSWRDAWTQEASTWCDYELRCMPDWFYNHFPDHRTCVYVEVARACEQRPCDHPYPESRDSALAQCDADMSALGCGALFPPDSCLEAFQ